jgi:pimeloyl-ACP methyl ester carboxylesterase
VVVSGVGEVLARVVDQLTHDGVKVKNLVVSQAFHSPLLDPMLDDFEKRAAELTFQAPDLPLVSNLTGDVLGPATMDAAYLREHARRPVRFADGLSRLMELGCQVLIEIGPSPHLCGIARDNLPDNEHRLLASLRRRHGDWRTLLRSLGEAYGAGVPVDWPGFDRDFCRYRVELPTYAFNRKRHWYKVPERTREGPPASRSRSAVNTAEPANTTESSVSLLGDPISSPLDVTQFQAELTTDLHPSLADCASGATTVVNAGFYLEAVVQAAERTRGDATVHIEGLVIPHALVLPENGRVTTQLVIADTCGPRARFSYHSKQRDTSEWATHAQGMLTSTSKPTERMDVDAITARCPDQIDGTSFYRALWRRKIHLGPSAQWLSRIARRDGEAIARLRPADQDELRQGYHLHPGIIDSSLQLLLACLPPDRAEQVVVMLLEIEDYSFHGNCSGPLLCHAVLRDGVATAETLTADIALTGEDGVQVARMSGVHMKITDRAALMRTINSASVHKVRVPVSTTAARPEQPTRIAELIRRGEHGTAANLVRSALVDQIAVVLGTAPNDVAADVPLPELGMDSLLAVQIRDHLSAALAISLPAAWFLDAPTVDGLRDKVLSKLLANAPVEPQAIERTGPGGMHIVEYGTGEPIIFVHGGAFGGVDAWQSQRSLAERWRLVIVSRLNYGRSAASDGEDYREDGQLLAELLHEFDGGAHLVAQSYGTLGAIEAALRHPRLVRSLTMIESAASSVARGKPAVDEYERSMRELLAAPPERPEDFFRSVFAILEPTANYSDPLPETLMSFARRARRNMRWPWEADVDVAALRAAGFGKLIVSGGQRQMFEEISDALADQVAGERLIIPGGHGTQNTGSAFNTALERFLKQLNQSTQAQK